MQLFLRPAPAPFGAERAQEQQEQERYLAELKRPDQQHTAHIEESVGTLVPKLLEVGANLLWLLFLELEDIHDLLGDVNWVKGDDLEDHGEEDKRVRWNDNIDQS